MDEDGTDTDTESSYGENNYDYSDILHMDAEEQEQELYWTYKQHKGRFRRFMRKPVRKVRRFFRRK